MRAKIEKNVPFPSTSASYIAEQNWKKMEVSDSIFLKYPKEINKVSFRVQVMRHVNNLSVNERKEWRFTSVSEETGVRVWRVK